jgi:two-component system OmpR family sensor kinase
MSLRIRLTFLYTTLLGVVLLLFSLLIFGLVSYILINEVDTNLNQAANNTLPLLRVNSNNQFDPRSLSTLELNENLIIQVFNNKNVLQITRPYGWLEPLDKVSLLSRQAGYSSSTSDNTPMRVLTIPLKTIRGPAGTLQIGGSLSLLISIQGDLVVIVIGTSLAAMLITAIATWIITSRAIAPLSTVTRVATQITRADDLSRRIPISDTADEEFSNLITAFNQTLERLESLFNTQKRFLADVSHELRTPLTVIKGNVALVRKIGEADEESLTSIDEEVDRLTRMVGDILLLAQAEQGQLPLDYQKVELDTVLLEVFQQMRVISGEKVKLSIEDIEQIQIIGDRDRLKQVILNLLGNAVQYTPPQGEVTLSLNNINQQARLVVRNSGPGISLEDIPHIFERFYRGEKSRTRGKGTGFGLGLSIAYWIVRAHGGHIDVSSSEGKGTTFTVWLPFTPPEPAINETSPE